VLAEFLACGLDPEKATLYIQSDLPETAELYLLLNMNAYIGELERCTSFKEKIRTQPQNVNAGLLTYPTLMAADIIIHRAQKVPVGKDQEQHLEMTRTFANRFNRLYNQEYFPEPVAYNFGENLVKIPGLDGGLKMSKSDNENSSIFLADTPEIIRKKVMKAVTDSGPVDLTQPRSQGVKNIFDLMSYFSKPDVVAHFEAAYQAGNIRYGDMKKQLAEDIILFTTPFREKIEAITADADYLKKVARLGADKARASAAKTVSEVREIIGFRHF
jgi:tryptophanyl-tRNA synthetase